MAIRFTDTHNRNHFVVLNTESLLAVEPGEGHEQPDQLQLLYYVDGESVIADAGYDHGGTVKGSFTYPFIEAVNSTWSKMSNHNVFSLKYREGLSEPAIETSNWIGKKANHGGIKNRSIFDSGNIKILSGSMEIIASQNSIYSDPKIADYERNVFVIEGGANIDPYFIDSNSHKFYDGLEYDLYIGVYESTRASLQYLIVSQNYTLNQWGVSNFTFGSNTLKLFTGITPYFIGNRQQEVISNYIFREKSGSTDEFGSIYRTSFVSPDRSKDGAAKEKNVISLISFTNNSINMERFYEDVYKGNPAVSSQYVAYKIDHGNSLDFIVKRILINGIGGNNPNFDGWNMRFKHGAIHFEFPGGNEFAFARYTNQNGKWALDETRSLNIVDKTVDLITQNVTIGNTQSLSPFKNIQIANNVIITVNGNANFEGKILKMGNNSKIRFLSGTPNLKNLTLESALATDTYTVEVGNAYQLKIKSDEKVSLSGKANLTGYNMRIDQGGELEIKDGSNVTFSDSFQFYNYGTTKIGAGVTLNLKNFSNYSSSNTLINTNNGSRTNFNISAGGVINFGGLATVKGTTFKRKTTSNFSYVGISGSAIRSFENVTIEGSQYGFQVTNVPSGKVTFTNLTGNYNFYATLKSTNSDFVVDGFTGKNATQDGMSAYSGSTITLRGNIVATDNLLGLRSAYGSNIKDEYEFPMILTLTGNTRGIHVYNNNGTQCINFNNSSYNITDNTRPDNLYSVEEGFDLFAINSSRIFITGENISGTDPVESKDATSGIAVDFSNDGGFGQVSKNGEEDILSMQTSIKSRTAFYKTYQEKKKKPEFTKAARKQWIEPFKTHSERSIRSGANLVDVLDLAKEGDFSWITSINKSAHLKHLLDEDANQIAEQLFYYYTTTQPNQSESAYWLTQLENDRKQSYGYQ